jgi:hypothetical protein
MAVGVDRKLISEKFISPSEETAVSYLPWKDGRPWGGNHQCIFLSVIFQNMGVYKPVMKSLTICDENCEDFEEGCFVCRSDRPATKFLIRGLCHDSKQVKWVWLDRKDNKSLAFVLRK